MKRCSPGRGPNRWPNTSLVGFRSISGGSRLSPLLAVPLARGAPTPVQTEHPMKWHFSIEEPPNTALQLTSTDAAQSAILSLCLLSVLAAECHVGLAENA